MENLYSAQLANFVERIHCDDLSAEVIQMAKNCFLDWLGCVYASRNDSGVKKMAEVARLYRGCNHSTVIPYREKNSAPFAALVNGAATHALEMDDVNRNSIVHPAAVVIPAVYAVGEREGVSGKRLIEAIVSGYEVMIRVGEGVGRSHYWFWHNTSTCGNFGSAAGVGKILGLSLNQYIHALGNAGSQSSGLWEFLSDGANTKLLHTGKAAMNGILAADLAKRNFTGARKIFEGEKGFYRAMSKDYNLDKLADGLGEKSPYYRILSNSFKLYPSCRHTHSSIDATLSLVTEHDLKWKDIEKAEVYTYSGAINLCGAVELKNPYVAKWHIPFVVATAIKDRRVGLDSFTEATIREKTLIDLAKKISLHLDPELDAAFPAQFPSRVEISLKGGRKVSKTIYYPKGDSENPPSQEELNNKFRDNIESFIQPHSIERLIETIDRLETIKDVSTLIQGLRFC